MSESFSSFVVVLRPRPFFGWLVQAKFPPIAFSIQPSSILANRFHPPIEDDDDDEEDWNMTLSKQICPFRASCGSISLPKVNPEASLRQQNAANNS